jgi:hypothetical protein
MAVDRNATARASGVTVLLLWRIAGQHCSYVYFIEYSEKNAKYAGPRAVCAMTAAKSRLAIVLWMEHSGRFGPFAAPSYPV